MKKIVFFDIDGTLVNDEKKLPDSTKEAIFKLKDKGVYVAIATGRAPFMFADLREELGIDSYVSLNGQYVVFEDEVIYQHAFQPEHLELLAKLANQYNHPLVFLDEKMMRANVDYHPYVEEGLASLKFPHPEKIDNINEMENIFQALVFCSENEELKYEQLYKQFYFLRWHRVSVDVLPLNGSKAKGIEKLIERLDFSLKDVYAFGDGLNDIEMLKAVGTGVAMGNAREEVKQHADLITKEVDEDGIYYGLKELKLIQL